MASRRRGNIVAYWGTLDATGAPVASAVTLGTFSKKVYVNESLMNFAFLVNVSATAVVSLWAASSTQLNPEGDSPDRSVAPADALFAPVQWNATPASASITGAGSAYIIVPDFVAGWTALKSSTSVNIWAGYEAL